MKKRLSLVTWTLFLGLGLAACSSVNIQTGPPTEEEAASDASERARLFRVDMANRLQTSPALEQASIVRTLIDSSTASYLRYGFRVADMWTEESARRGFDIPVSEIQTLVENSNKAEFPMFDAYEEVIDHGLELIGRSRDLTTTAERLLANYRDYHSEVLSAVFYPNGTVEEYDARLRRLRTDGEEMSRDLRLDLNRQ